MVIQKCASFIYLYVLLPDSTVAKVVVYIVWSSSNFSSQNLAVIIAFFFDLSDHLLNATC